MSDLAAFIDKPINVVTCDGRIIVGILKGFDQMTNLILGKCHERVFSLTGPVGVVQLGVYILRGDNVAVVGLIDEQLEGEIEYEQVRAPPIAPVVH